MTHGAQHAHGLSMGHLLPERQQALLHRLKNSSSRPGVIWPSKMAQRVYMSVSFVRYARGQKVRWTLIARLRSAAMAKAASASLMGIWAERMGDTSIRPRAR